MVVVVVKGQEEKERVQQRLALRFDLGVRTADQNSVTSRALSHLPFAINSASRANRYWLRPVMLRSDYRILMKIVIERRVAMKYSDTGIVLRCGDILKRVNIFSPCRGAYFFIRFRCGRRGRELK